MDDPRDHQELEIEDLDWQDWNSRRTEQRGRSRSLVTILSLSILSGLAWAWHRGKTFASNALALTCFRRWRDRTAPSHRTHRSKLSVLLDLICTSLVALGLFHLISLALSCYVRYFPDEIDLILEHWGEPGHPSEGLAHWPNKFVNVEPIQCHSHNDYWRDVPLYEAINFGCISVEADIWLVDEEVYVSHRRWAINRNRTLQNLYIDPLVEILELQNSPTKGLLGPPDKPVGVFNMEPDQTLVLLLDFKSSGPDLWPFVEEQLSPLRDRGFLTFWNGTNVIRRQITVVASGKAPYDLIVANQTYRDIFLDAPLDTFGGPTPYIPTTTSSSSVEIELPPYSESNSYYASISFKKSIGHLWRSHLSQEQLTHIQTQIREAHEAGLQVRYWGIPSWPRGLRNHIWHILIREGVDVLNTDDLTGATMRDWRRNKGWWF